MNHLSALLTPRNGRRRRSPPVPTRHGRQRAEPRVSGVLPHGPIAVELVRAADVAIALLALAAVFLITNADGMLGEMEQFILVRITPENLLLVGGIGFAWPISFAALGLYKSETCRRRRDEFLRIVAACTLGSAPIFLFVAASERGALQARTAVVFWISVILLISVARQAIRLGLARSQATTAHRVIIVGSGPRAYRLYRNLLDNATQSFEVLGFVDTADASPFPEIRQRMLGSLEDLEEVLMRQVVDEVLVALPVRSCYLAIQNAISVCERVGVESRYLADVFQSSLRKPQLEQVAQAPVVAVKVADDSSHRLVKRVIDVVGALLGLVLLSPLLLVIALAIKLSGPGPVVFVQQRFGYKKRLFNMYKFRTMVPDAETLQISFEHLNEANGPVFKIKDDPRTTPLGRFLRRTSLDELPQLINVLRGEMSLVGPRPLPTRDVHRFSEAWLMRRFSVPPGLTCLWQISGRSNLSFTDWIALDLRYIDTWSLLLDFRILMRTLPVVLRRTGAS